VRRRDGSLLVVTLAVVFGPLAGLGCGERASGVWPIGDDSVSPDRIGALSIGSSSASSFTTAGPAVTIEIRVVKVEGPWLTGAPLGGVGFGEVDSSSMGKGVSQVRTRSLRANMDDDFEEELVDGTRATIHVQAGAPGLVAFVIAIGGISVHSAVHEGRMQIAWTHSPSGSFGVGVTWHPIVAGVAPSPQ
jgi:hypothetical protein